MNLLTSPRLCKLFIVPTMTWWSLTNSWERSYESKEPLSARSFSNCSWSRPGVAIARAAQPQAQHVENDMSGARMRPFTCTQYLHLTSHDYSEYSPLVPATEYSCQATCHNFCRKPIFVIIHRGSHRLKDKKIQFIICVATDNLDISKENSDS